MKDLLRNIRFAAALFSCLLVVGCSTSSQVAAPKREFFLRNPALKDRYVEFNETSIETIRQCVEDALHGKLAILSGVRKNLPASPTTAEYLGAVEKRLHDDYEGKMEFIREIAQSFDPDRDSLFYYSYKDDTRQEQGWAIVRNGRLQKKFPLASAPEVNSK